MLFLSVVSIGLAGVTVTVSCVVPSCVSVTGICSTTRRRGPTFSCFVASGVSAAETLTVATRPTSVVRFRTIATTKNGRPSTAERPAYARVSTRSGLSSVLVCAASTTCGPNETVARTSRSRWTRPMLTVAIPPGAGTSVRTSFRAGSFLKGSSATWTPVSVAGNSQPAFFALTRMIRSARGGPVSDCSESL